MAGQWSRLYVFGDSYCDSGAGYVDGNGPTAVVYLADGLGIPFTYATDSDRKAKGLNFAVSGAPTGAGEGTKLACERRGITEKIIGRGILTQVRDFVARVKVGEIAFLPGTTLFFIAGGLNDQAIPTDETIKNVEEAIGDLYAVGGRHVRIALLPTRIASFSKVGERLNSALTQIPERIHFAGLDIRMSRWGHYFDAIMDHPEAYGLTNVTEACAGRALFDEDPAPKGDARTYYFYHADHPSTAVHRIVGAFLVEEVLAVERRGEPSRLKKMSGT